MTEQMRRIVRLLNEHEMELVSTVRPVTVVLNFDFEDDEQEFEFDTLTELEDWLNDSDELLKNFWEGEEA